MGLTSARRIGGFNDEDEALLFDVFCSVIRDVLGRVEFNRHSFEGFQVDKREHDDALFLRIQTGIGYERLVQWDGTIADAIKEVANFASTLSSEL